MSFHDMAVKLPDEIFVHEAGHLVVGLLSGIREQGVSFANFKPGEGAQAWYSVDTPENGIKRSLAGLLAHIELLSATIPDDLRDAYRQSIILDETHDYYQRTAEAERVFLSGARTDVQIAEAYAEQLVGKDIKKISKLLRGIENKVKALVAENRRVIQAVADDMRNWLSRETAENNAMMLYDPRRAEAILDGFRSRAHHGE